MKAYAAGTRRLLGARLVDSGSADDAQSDMPVHIGLALDHVGLPRQKNVDVEVAYPGGGRRQVTTLRGVDTRAPQTNVLRTR